MKDGEDGISFVDAERWCRSERDKATLEPKAEALIAKLRRGKNFFTPPEYRLLVVYLTPGGPEADEAHELGVMVYGAYEIVRVTWRADAEWVTDEKLAEIAGKSVRAIRELLRAAEFPFKRERVGKRGPARKLYDLTALRAAYDDLFENSADIRAVG